MIGLVFDFIFGVCVAGSILVCSCRVYCNRCWADYKEIEINKKATYIPYMILLIGIIGFIFLSIFIGYFHILFLYMHN